MQYSSLLATIVALSATTTSALPAAAADVFDPPTQYGYDGKPLDASFCRTAGSREKDCRKDVQACDKKYDDQEGRETACAKGIREKYKPAVVYGYDGKPLDLGFCTLAGIREVDCRKDAQTCDKKYESDKCLNAIKEKYKPVVDPNPPAYGYDGKPLDASFCRSFGAKENECRKDILACDKKFDNEGRESACSKAIREKYKPFYVAPPVYGYDGKPLDASFCKGAGSKENECKKDILACDKKYDNEGRETACAKAIREKYKTSTTTPVNYGYDGKPLDASFCKKFPSREAECRKDVENCDRKFDDQGRETKCSKDIKEKYKEEKKADEKKEKDGKRQPTNADFCKRAGTSVLEAECRKAVKECDKKYQNIGHEKECSRDLEDKYTKGSSSYGSGSGSYGPGGY
ncbi:hypothetical protein BLS_005944 [Venturia inaequalis]|uniref:Cellophane-induced protein 1 n=1 Tax=Venturia inaequalis TaxID=5025 RepID=A0A8H3YSB2_VENIN|nr:hypothetical protein BLS_005944 [Venturia inaequalis]